jgi:hypothetical protein
MGIVAQRLDGFAFGFDRGELDLDGKIYTAIANIACSQPIEEGVIFGSAPVPLARTRGQQQIGDGTIEFSDVEEAVDFLDRLGQAPEGRLAKIFNASYVLRHPTDESRVIRVELRSCRLLNWEIDWSTGAEGLPVPMPISFMKRLLNGKPDIGD